jgi:transposase
MSQRYEEKFKLDIVQRHTEGASIKSLARDFGVDRTTVKVWIRRYSSSQSFVKKDNLTKLERENKELKEENKRLREENYHLQQAALILWKKKEQ